MARSIGKTRKTTKSSKAAKGILQQFLAELEQETDAGGSVTKGQALVKIMINDALGGDQHMLGHVLRLIGKLDMPREEAKPEDIRRPGRAEWEMLFAFFGKYEPFIRQEIERLRESNPAYWNFSDWFYPTLESAPWYADIYS